MTWPSCIASSRALDLGRGAVDLVGQQDAGDDRAGPGVEGAGRRAVDLRAGQVGREQVGGELDRGGRAGRGPGQGAHGPGLGQAGDALDQDVAAGQQATTRRSIKRPLADDGASRRSSSRQVGTLGRVDGVGGAGGSRRSPTRWALAAASRRLDQVAGPATFHHLLEDVVGRVAGVLDDGLAGLGGRSAAFLAA